VAPHPESNASVAWTRVRSYDLCRHGAVFLRRGAKFSPPGWQAVTISTGEAPSASADANGALQCDACASVLTSPNPRGQIIIRYWYSWTAIAAIFGGAVLLAIPYFAVIALLIVVIVALAAVIWAIVYVPYVVVRAIHRRGHHRGSASLTTVPALPVQAPAYAHLSRRSIDYPAPVVGGSAESVTMTAGEVGPDRRS
jgi:hypothetical protein